MGNNFRGGWIECQYGDVCTTGKPVFGVGMNNLPRVLIIDENESDQKLASLVLAGEFGNLEPEPA